TLTLPGIAGRVLTLAVAADANIVMYERIEEEVRSGGSIPAAISTGYTKALKATIDADVVTVGVSCILCTLSTACVQGFGSTRGADLGEDAGAGAGEQGRVGAQPEVRHQARQLLGRLDRADLRNPDREDGGDRDHRVAVPDRDLHRDAVRDQVRGAGSDRTGP